MPIRFKRGAVLPSRRLLVPLRDNLIYSHQLISQLRRIYFVEKPTTNQVTYVDATTRPSLIESRMRRLIENTAAAAYFLLKLHILGANLRTN